MCACCRRNDRNNYKAIKPFKTLNAVAAPLPSANIDTDQIVPARFLQKPRSDNSGNWLLCDLRREPDGSPRAAFPLNQPAFEQARIIAAGPNFGCGSSREHAVWALYGGQFRAVIAASFGDIFSSNALKNGFLPIRLPQATVSALLATLAQTPATRLTVDLETQSVSTSAGLLAGFSVDPFARHGRLEGIDKIDYTLSLDAEIKAFERGLAPLVA
jgi:3-isopropylmalate/(R)-2-methylmalate dehydratase small subunit